MRGIEVLCDRAKTVAGTYLKYNCRSTRNTIHRIKVEKKDPCCDDHNNNDDRPCNIFSRKYIHSFYSYERLRMEFTIASVKKFASMLDPP